MHDVPVLAGAEEFSLGSGRVGALLLHGFTGSPQSMRGLGEFLADNGLRVVAPRLPGHGTTWQDCNASTAEQWTDAVEEGFARLAAETAEVFVVALSFGASLAVELIARHPDQIAGLVTLAGFVQTKDPRRFLAPVLSRVIKSLPGVSNDIADPEYRELAYDRVPTVASAHMLRVLKAARAKLPQVTCPVLVMHARNDHTVAPWNAELIYNGVGSTDKSIVWLERSYHVITLDLERDDVFRHTLEFIKERARHGV